MSSQSVIRVGEDGHLLDGIGGVRELGAPLGERRLEVTPALLGQAAQQLIQHGGRWVTLHATEGDTPDLVAVIAHRGELVSLRARLPAELAQMYASLAELIPAASLDERQMHDEHRIVPIGHPDLAAAMHPDADVLPRTVEGPEVFVIPYGPVRSGIFESIQFVIETGGEDILGLGVRPFFKHRAMERRFDGATAAHGGAVAERVAGIASVAHAIAYCEAVERALGIEPPRRAALWRTVNAELERIANHLDVAAKLAEDAALAVGVARFTILKEDTMRLRARLTGSRFGRGLVVPGGIAGEPLLATDAVAAWLKEFERDLRRDRSLLLRTPSFTDRLIGSGTLDRATVVRLSGVGPVARASGVSTDARFERPYGAYSRLGFDIVVTDAGDAMARLDVRFGEMRESIHLIRQALDCLARAELEPLAAEPDRDTGDAYGWAEAPQGEVVYWIEMRDGAIARAHVASPSLRNWPLLAASFRGDVLTDFSFIEHSFGLTSAGADR